MNEFNELISQFNADNISILDFVINLLLTLITSYILSFAYSRYGASLSNRNKLAQTLVLLSITTMIIITIVKSSLALSLGLVGALSIVRFRTAIKEPEELAYFFIAISIGLGFGADQKSITLVGVLFVILFVILTGSTNKKKQAQQNLILSIVGTSGNVNESKIIETLKGYCSQVDIRRIDQTNEIAELSLSVEFNGVEDLILAKQALSDLGQIEFSFIERH